MISSRRLHGIVCALVFLNAGAIRAEDCSSLLAAFDRALEIARVDDAQELVDRISKDATCGQMQIPVQRRLAAFRLAAVQILMARNRPVADFDQLLIAAEKPEVLWKASAVLGEVRFGERRFADAARAFDRAIEIIKNETRTPTPPSKAEIKGLLDRAAQSRLLAANATAGLENERFVETARDQRDGTLGGMYSPSVRGIALRAIPVPITFDYRKTSFTGVGKEAALEFVTALKEQRPSRIVLVGHTDMRGSAETNMKLSYARAEAVSGFLRQHGVDISVETVGRGASEPMRLSDPSGLTQEDIYALNRRVEWRRD